MQAGWNKLGGFWTSFTKRRVKHSALYANVVEAGMSGLQALSPTRAQMDSLISVLCEYLRDL